jgi:hypothetical protein
VFRSRVHKKKSGKHTTSKVPISAASLAHGAIPFEPNRLGIYGRVMTKPASNGDSFGFFGQAGMRPRPKAEALRALKLEFSAKGPRSIVTPYKV